MKEFSYHIYPQSSVTDKLVSQCCTLFSQHYGTWIKNNKRVRMGKEMMKENYLSSENSGIVCAFEETGNLVGHCIYQSFECSDSQCIWVTQLVVHTDFRSRGIAKDLLRLIWLEDYDVMGIISSNPYAIMCLESVTELEIYVPWIREFAPMVLETKPITYFPDSLDENSPGDLCSVYTDFPVDVGVGFVNGAITKRGWSMQNLEVGHELFAMVTRDLIYDNTEDSAMSEEDLVAYHFEFLLENKYVRKSTRDYILQFLRDTNQKQLLKKKEIYRALTSTRYIRKNIKEQLFRAYQKFLIK